MPILEYGWGISTLQEKLPRQYQLNVLSQATVSQCREGTFGICTAEGIYQALGGRLAGSFFLIDCKGSQFDTFKMDRFVWIFSQVGAYFLKSR